MPHIQMNRNENNQSILIVDDDEMILDILSKGFEMYGLNVVKADNGLDGWELFKNKPVKIVLTDISMPGLDGIELSRRIRNASPNTTIALMTGGDAYIAKELLNDRTAKYLFTKPFAKSDVCKPLIADAQRA